MDHRAAGRHTSSAAEESRVCHRLAATHRARVGAHQLGAAIESAASSDAASLARRLLLGSGRGRVYVDWPYADVAVATSLATAAGRWWADRRGQLQECDIHPGEWRQLQDELRLNTLHHRALDTGRVALVVYARPRPLGQLPRSASAPRAYSRAHPPPAGAPARRLLDRPRRRPAGACGLPPAGAKGELRVDAR